MTAPCGGAAAGSNLRGLVAAPGRFVRRCDCGGPLSWAPRNHHAEAPSCEWCGAQLEGWDIVDVTTGATVAEATLDHGPGEGTERLLLGLERYLNPLPRERAA